MTSSQFDDFGAGEISSSVVLCSGCGVCCVVWCGVGAVLVWCGVALGAKFGVPVNNYHVVWCGVVRAVWCGVVWCVAVWVWCGCGCGVWCGRVGLVEMEWGV